MQEGQLTEAEFEVLIAAAKEKDMEKRVKMLEESAVNAMTVCIVIVIASSFLLSATYALCILTHPILILT